MITLLTISFLFLPSTAHAEWLQITETDAAVHFIDSSSVRKIGDIRLVWELQNIKMKKRPPFWWQER